jgi:hypothetical protein
MLRRRSDLPCLLFMVATAAASCRPGSAPPRWEPPPIETRQSPLLLPIDGMTDVTKLCTPSPCATGTALRNAISDALTQGKRALYFPPGEHAIEGNVIFLPSDTTIAGMGRTSILKRTGSSFSGSQFFHIDGSSNVTIGNVAFVLSRAGETPVMTPAIYITSSAGAVSTNIRIANNYFISDDTTARTAILADGAAKLSEVWLTGNYTKNVALARASSMQLQNIFITDNRVDGSLTDGVALYTSGSPIRYENFIISHNNFANVSRYGVRVGGADGAEATGLMQNIRIANNNISAAGSGSAAYGVLAMELVIPPGTQDRPNRNLSITGNTIWRSQTSSVLFYGIAVDRPSSNPAWADNVIISGNSIRDEADRALYRGIRAAFLRNSIISDNNISNPEYAIMIDQHEGLVIKGNTLTATQTDSMTGIKLGFGSDALVTGNVVTGKTGPATSSFAFMLGTQLSLTTPKTAFTNIMVRGNRFNGLGSATCALYHQSAGYDVRYVGNDLRSNTYSCGGVFDPKAFVDNLLDAPSSDGRLVRHLTGTKVSHFIATASDQDTITVFGAREGDAVAVGAGSVGAPGLPAGVTLQGFVSGNDTVTVRAFRSATAVTTQIDITVRASVLQYAN